MPQTFFPHIFREAENHSDNRFLEDLTSRYPYFAAAHFFLMKNTDRNDPSYAERTAKAAVFFDAPHLAESQLQKQEKQEEVQASEIMPPEEMTQAEIVQEEKIAEQLKAEAESEPEINPIPQPVEPVQEAPLFEPLHATDYFASQGIRLSDEALGTDKLGQQLKSFTAWLKTMKKVHPERMGTAAVNETVIQNLAEKSNMEAEVVTEAMAEAYAQQGKTVQAIETWSKLSLQNPAKSAYFAAKIDSLKH